MRAHSSLSLINLHFHVIRGCSNKQLRFNEKCAVLSSRSAEIRTDTVQKKSINTLLVPVSGSRKRYSLEVYGKYRAPFPHHSRSVTREGEIRYKLSVVVINYHYYVFNYSIMYFKYLLFSISENCWRLFNSSSFFFLNHLSFCRPTSFYLLIYLSS